MKINEEKIKEAERFQNEMAKLYDERSLGVRIARNSLPDWGIKYFASRSTEKKLRRIENDIFLAGQRFRDFTISSSDDGYEISYECMPIRGLNEFARCKRDFTNKISKFVESREDGRILEANDDPSFFNTAVNKFLNMLEEAIEEE